MIMKIELTHICVTHGSSFKTQVCIASYPPLKKNKKKWRDLRGFYVQAVATHGGAWHHPGEVCTEDRLACTPGLWCCQALPGWMLSVELFESEMPPAASYSSDSRLLEVDHDFTDLLG